MQPSIRRSKTGREWDSIRIETISGKMEKNVSNSKKRAAYNIRDKC